jgi:hypothetical protein
MPGSVARFLHISQCFQDSKRRIDMMLIRNLKYEFIVNGAKVYAAFSFHNR